MTVVRFAAAARDEFRAAAEGYEEVRAGYGQRFRDAVAAASDLIAANPRIGAAFRRTALREWC